MKLSSLTSKDSAAVMVCCHLESQGNSAQYPVTLHDKTGTLLPARSSQLRETPWQTGTSQKSDVCLGKAARHQMLLRNIALPCKTRSLPLHEWPHGAEVYKAVVQNDSHLSTLPCRKLSGWLSITALCESMLTTHSHLHLFMYSGMTSRISCSITSSETVLRLTWLQFPGPSFLSVLKLGVTFPLLQSSGTSLNPQNLSKRIFSGTPACSLGIVGAACQGPWVHVCPACLSVPWPDSLPPKVTLSYSRRKSSPIQFKYA